MRTVLCVCVFFLSRVVPTHGRWALSLGFAPIEELVFHAKQQTQRLGFQRMQGLMILWMGKSPQRLPPSYPHRIVNNFRYLHGGRCCVSVLLHEKCFLPLAWSRYSSVLCLSCLEVWRSTWMMATASFTPSGREHSFINASMELRLWHVTGVRYHQPPVSRFTVISAQPRGPVLDIASKYISKNTRLHSLSSEQLLPAECKSM